MGELADKTEAYDALAKELAALKADDIQANLPEYSQSDAKRDKVQEAREHVSQVDTSALDEDFLTATGKSIDDVFEGKHTQRADWQLANRQGKAEDADGILRSLDPDAADKFKEFKRERAESDATEA